MPYPGPSIAPRSPQSFPQPFPRQTPQPFLIPDRPQDGNPSPQPVDW
ncbi:MAG: hypothetical protein AAGF75_04235 [Cyanobacteria bacterium P01_H01_bin.130]